MYFTITIKYACLPIAANLMLCYFFFFFVTFCLSIVSSEHDRRNIGYIGYSANIRIRRNSNGFVNFIIS